MRVGITDKRLANKRFRKTEEAILRVFFEENIYIGMGELAEKAGVARSTIYHHHKTVRGIVVDYERYILRKYKRTMAKMLRARDTSTRMLYSKTLMFIIQHKQIFLIVIRGGRNEVFDKMMMVIKLTIEDIEKLPKNAVKIIDVYAGEVGVLLKRWGKGGFKENEVGVLLKDILYLTETMRVRLGPLER